jgi:hypothetical protein
MKKPQFESLDQMAEATAEALSKACAFPGLPVRMAKKDRWWNNGIYAIETKVGILYIREVIVF